MIVLSLPYPISANRLWKTAVRSGHAVTYVSAEGKAYKAEVAAICAAAGIRAPLSGRVQLALQLYPHRPKDFRARMRKLGAAWDDGVNSIDLDNANKVVLDALKGIAIDDDRWVRKLQSERMEPDDGPARVVVYIRQLRPVMGQQELIGKTP